MRILSRNKQELWFANHLSDSFVTDNNGLKTGEKTQTYTTPVKTRMSIEMPKGRSDFRSYGIVPDYDIQAITEDKTCSMDEQSIVWFGILPTHTETRTITTEGQTTTTEVEVPNPHNYVVTKRTKSLNHIVYQLKEVDVS